MTKRIRIMYVMDHFYRPTGGTEGQVFNLVQRLDPNRFHTELCVFRYNSDFFSKNTFPCSVNCLYINTFYDPRSLLKLQSWRKYLIKNKFDVVQTFFNETAMTIPLVLRSSGIRVIGSRRDMGFWYNGRKLFLLRLANRCVSKFLVNSFAVRDNVMLKEAVSPDKIEVIYNGHDMKRFEVEKDDAFLKKYNIPENSLIIGIVANLRPVKRVGDLITAFKKIAEKFDNAFLVSIGHHGWMVQEYTDLAQRLGIGDRVRFIGNMDNVLPIIRHFSVGVICSESEGLSNTLIEYMGCGVPVVATRTGGNVELVTDLETGFLVKVGDPAELADAVIRIIEDPKLQKTLTENASRAVKSNFSLEKNIQAHESVYANTLRNHPNQDCSIYNSLVSKPKNELNA